MQTRSKKSGLIVKKQLRLFSFQTYDEKPCKSNENSSDEEKSNRFKDQQEFVIQMFGLNEKGETFCLYIRDFLPFFYVSAADDWTPYNMRSLVEEIKKKLPKHMQESILEAELVDYNKLYGFSAGKKSKFIKFTFKNSIVMKKVRSLWIEYIEDVDRPGKSTSKMRPFIYQGVNVQLYESNIPPLLRYFHIHNISPSGWIEIPANRVERVENKTTTCKYEYICRANQLKPLPEKETPVPYKICSFDIEANSSHGDFPVPIKTYKRLSMNMIDCYLKQKDLIDSKNLKIMLQKMILTAFEYDTFDDIDVVYPKSKPTKDQVKKYVKILLDEPMEIAKHANKDQDTSYLLTIDEMFEQMKERSNCMGDADAECSEMVANETGAEEGPVYKFNKKSAKKKVDIKSTVVDMVLSENYTRDEKIQLLNDILTRLFPPLEGDQITCIGSTFMRYGEPDTYLNHCLVLGTCDPVEGATIDAVDDERELLVRWSELIQQEDPDIIIGYNIFGFDYEFMLRRSQELHCEQEFLNVSRKMNEFCGVYDKEGMLQLDNTPLRLATGDYDLKYFKLSGRLQIDLYTYFRREYNLPSYKLDYVAGENICDSIVKVVHSHDSSGNEMTELYSKNLTGLHVNDFIHIGYVGFTSDYYKNGDKFRVIDILRNVEITETVKGAEVKNKYNIIVIEGHEHIDSKRAIKWGSAKDDVSPQDISRLFKTDAAGRAIVAKYCIQDCNLVHYIMNKIDVLTGFVEMSSICSVPMNFLMFRGQGIKLTSFVAKKCMENGMLMPELDKTSNDSGYEGAIVLPPKCSMYMDNPVACVDYSSLYPSSMISQNLSHDSKVWTKEFDLTGKLLNESGQKGADGNYLYDELQGYKYIDLEFDTFRYVRKTPTSRAEKVKSGTKICRWAQFPDHKKGILPSILEQLLKARSDTRKKQKTEKDPFIWNILEKRQLGYKVTANSLYGQCGSSTSTFYEKDIAASTTATGRMMILYARRIIEEVYGDRLYETLEHGSVKCNAEYVYGDSVANYTPVYVKYNGFIDIVTIEQLGEKYGNNKWITCKEEGKQEKEYCELEGIETWSDKGWTKLYRIIRHTLAQHKKMMRVLTHTGLVDVTDDHSLIKTNGEEISPKDVIVGSELLHYSLPPCENIAAELTEERAKVMGFFFGDGSCGEYHCSSGKKSSWALNNSCPDMLNKYLDLCKIAHPEHDWRIMDTLESSGVCKISPRNKEYGSIVKFVRYYREKLYFEKSKIIPSEILNGPEKIRNAFWEGLYDADGDKDANGYIRIDQKNQISAACIARLASTLGMKFSINTRVDKQNVYRITMTNKSQRKNANAVKKIHEIEYSGYVYDLTTENHHFAAGIGNMIVHNTDSVFFTFNLENPETKEKIRGKPALEMTIEIAQDAAKLCTQWLKPPMELSYEKTLMPFILVAKKKYVGMLYETDPNKGKLKFMGLSIKRRDSCDYLKDVYGGILNILMKEYDIKKAIEFLDSSLAALLKGDVPTDKLMMTKQLKSDYKNPTRMEHWVLSDRIGKRDPGNKPKSGDRIKFLHFVNPDAKLNGDRIETPEFIRDNNLTIDYTYYITNQLMKPLQQLFSLALEQIWEMYNKGTVLRKHRKEVGELEKQYPDRTVFMKKREILCCKKIKEMLFDKYLEQIQNEKTKTRTISQFFVKK
jgi:DNA polymerase elongation subunit (family B)